MSVNLHDLHPGELLRTQPHFTKGASSPWFHSQHLEEEARLSGCGKGRGAPSPGSWRYVIEFLCEGLCHTVCCCGVSERVWMAGRLLCVWSVCVVHAEEALDVSLDTGLCSAHCS